MSDSVTLKFQLSDWTLARVRVPVDVVRVGALSQALPVADPQPPTHSPRPGALGFMLRDVPVCAALPPLQRCGGYLRYATQQYDHCYIDMGGDFDTYRQKFSSKTRSTITRKVKKFAEHSGGTLRWTSHRTPQELTQFFAPALALSAKTYQERLLDAGLPGDEAFRRRALQMAADDGVRAFLLYDGDRPVSYLYCPVEDDVLVYAYLGYDPAYKQFSVGTVLQWVALEQLFGERRFRHFDFTEGQSDHKRLFATHQQACANLLFVRASLRCVLLVNGHRLCNAVSEGAGRVLDRWGLKSAIRRALRFGARAAV